jgi:predicted metal-dependent RNase
MIGFTLFLLLFTNTYNAYETRIDALEKYTTADFIVTKITNPDCFFIKEGGIISIPLLKTQESKDLLYLLKEEYKTAGIDFIIRIDCDDRYTDYPENLQAAVYNRIAVSKEIGVYLNEAQTKPGKLTVILWSVNP